MADSTKIESGAEEGAGGGSASDRRPGDRRGGVSAHGWRWSVAMIAEGAVVAARSADLIGLISRDVALKRVGPDWFAVCPFHAAGHERTPSLHVTPGKGWHCFGCGAGGDAIEWVKRYRRVDFAAAVAILNGPGETLSPKHSSLNSGALAPVSFRHDSRSNDRGAWSIWAEAQPLDCPSPATLYLKTRELWDGRAPLPVCLRYHPQLFCAEIKKPLPALVAAIEDGAIGNPSAARPVVAVQRIWLSERWEAFGGGSAPDSRFSSLRVRKKTLGAMGAGAVRLARPGTSLGLAEGVESAMAAALLFQMPVWAVCGAARFERVAMALPDAVREVLFFADADDAGIAAAKKARDALVCGPRDVAALICVPPAPAKDWNEALRA